MPNSFLLLTYSIPQTASAELKKQHFVLSWSHYEDANIYASEYSLYLPDKQLLQQKLTEWLLEFEKEDSEQ